MTNDWYYGERIDSIRKKAEGQGNTRDLKRFGQLLAMVRIGLAMANELNRDWHHRDFHLSLTAGLDALKDQCHQPRKPNTPAGLNTACRVIAINRIAYDPKIYPPDTQLGGATRPPLFDALEPHRSNRPWGPATLRVAMNSMAPERSKYAEDRFERHTKLLYDLLEPASCKPPKIGRPGIRRSTKENRLVCESCGNSEADQLPIVIPGVIGLTTDWDRHDHQVDWYCLGCVSAIPVFRALGPTESFVEQPWSPDD